MSFRRLLLLTHRWIGLSTSLLLAVVGGTGAIIVWKGGGPLHQAAGRLHETLALGRVGAWLVLIATGGAVVLQLGGLILWWQRMGVSARAARGRRGTFYDLHQAAGALCLWLMLALAVTGFGMATIGPGPVRRKIVDLHTARTFSQPTKMLYAMGSVGFLIQGMSGVMMWWTSRRR